MEQQQSSHRLLLVLIAAASSFLIFTTSERCFIKADVRNAITMAQTLRAHPEAPTIPEALLVLHPNVHSSAVEWTGQLNDSFYGFVRVRARVPGTEPVLYLFDVNLAGQRLHPGNEAARELMGKLQNNTLSETSQGSTLEEGAPDIEQTPEDTP